MKSFFVTDSDGNIVRTGTCQDEHFEAQAEAGQTVHEGQASGFSQYWDGAALRTYAPEVLAERSKYKAGHRWSRGQWIDERPLATAKQHKWDAIKAERDKAEFSTFMYGNWSFDADARSQMRIHVAVQAARNNPEFLEDWTLESNQVVAVDADAMIAIGDALALHVSNVHAKARLLRAAITAAASKEELDAIVW